MAWTTPGTATAGEVLTAAFWNTQVRDNFVELATLADGAAWRTWTPATRSGVTIGNGTEVGRYAKAGRFVAISYIFTLGSTSAITGDFVLQLPFNNARQQNVSALCTDFATNDYPGISIIANNNVYVRTINTAGTYASSGNLSATVPFTWGTSDYITITGVYEATS